MVALISGLVGKNLTAIFKLVGSYDIYKYTGKYNCVYDEGGVAVEQ